MDSKVRKLTILVAMLAVITVLGVVILTNWSRIKPTSAQNVESVSEAETDSGDITSEFDSGFAGADPSKQQGQNLTAFLSDETFFDQKKSAFQLKMEAENPKQLYFIATSVEHDMRVQIVDYKNHNITGQAFTLDVAGQGSYRDTDLDGVIYVSSLKAGDYVIKLEDTGDYIAPAESTVHVKEKIEYAEIPDISLLIKTEADIIAEEEDTGIKDALADADDTENSELQHLEGGKLGIDVSKWNREIDWNAVREAGITFAIIRCGYRGSSTGTIVEDPYFKQNIQGAKDAGLQVGVYFFTQAVSEVEAVEEASAALALCKDYNLDLPVYIDTESSGRAGRADNLDVATRTAVCDAFCKTIEAAGERGGIYASRNWFYHQLDTSKLAGASIWLAEYRKAPLYEGYYQMWQYTSRGSVNGIEGNVDLDICYPDQPIE